ncbi:MAG: hypothetical protein M1823_004953 [Watsoniomyces obsoletus]|nr:MAG: hypothetical protein M1823_004953 [Watsoniomyces obsoletus]
MGQRHNRRRLRGDRCRRRPPKASYDHRLEFIEEENLRYDTMDESLQSDLELGNDKWASAAQAAMDEYRYENRCKELAREGLADLEEAQRRMFGGEIGDEVSLCVPMLRVVFSLFGDLDYVDP